MSIPRIAVVGIGVDGYAGLGEEARRVLAAAECLVGGQRHLAMVPEDGRRRLAWASPLSATLEAIAAERGRRVVVLATGDPLWFGVASLLLRRFGSTDVRVYPAPSAFQLAAARLAWSLDEVTTISLHGRSPATLHRWLQPGRRVLALTEDGGGPRAVATALSERGFGPSRLTVLEELGGTRERVRSWRADEVPETPVADLNVVAVELAAVSDVPLFPNVPGLPEGAYRHDGQITKPEVRAATLAALAPYPGATLWDVGAGSGSVAIEWLRAEPGATAVAIEREPARAATIRANASNLGVPDLEVVEGTAPPCLEGLRTPDAVFVGGGVADPGLLDRCIEALRPGGRLVANAVTLSGEATLLAHRARSGGRLTRLAITRAEPLGDEIVWRPALPVTQWTVEKAWPAAS